MRININSEFALKVSALGTLLVVCGALTQRATNLAPAFEACVGDAELLGKLRALNDAAKIAAESAGKHTRHNWLRTLEQLRAAIVTVQGDEQAWTAETVRLACELHERPARARALVAWHKGLQAGLHSLYAFARTPEQAAEELLSTIRIIERDAREAA